FHYGPGNPRGERERTFTGDDNERMLIEATRVAFPHLEEAVDLCVRLIETPINSAHFAEQAEAASTALDGLITSIILTRKSVDPMFFAVHLRPYFESVLLGDKEYAGSAAAPLSVGMIDHILWSSDCVHAEYRSFQDHNIIYNVPAMKRLYADLMGKPSLVTRFLHSECADKDLLQRNAAALDSILSQVINFRGKHLAVAKSAYSLQNRLKAIWLKGASNVYNIGSAGYGLDTLEMILDLSKESRDKLMVYIPEPTRNNNTTNSHD
ncbi:MAG: monodechloroaminopyrrolnitrin synthase PrnB family protein, partial [Flavobacteriales bacterium]